MPVGAGGDEVPASGPQRTCIGCRLTTEAADLVRVTRTEDGGLAVGRSLPGRGAWLHADPDCLATATKRRAFARALRAPVRDGAAEALGPELGV